MNHPVVFGAGKPAQAAYTVSPDEAYMSLEELRESHPRRHQMPLEYDVATCLAGMPSPWKESPLVVCLWDGDGKCNPSNLAAVKGAKVLVCGDTHHGSRPISRAIDLAIREPWDLVVLAYNKHHVHWFDEAGVGSGRTVFLPGFGMNPVRIEVPERRTRGVTMCGRLTLQHVYRGCFLSALSERKVPVELHEGDAEYCARIYNESVVSLNISLNGDFNLRNFEIAAAGGFCLADRTAVEPPMRPGAVFEGLDDAERMIAHLLAHPEESLAQARRDHAAFWSNRSPRKHLEDLELALAAPKGKRSMPAALFQHRLGLYEEMQELTRRGLVFWDDFKDLRRWPAETHPGAYA